MITWFQLHIIPMYSECRDSDQSYLHIKPYIRMSILFGIKITFVPFLKQINFKNETLGKMTPGPLKAQKQEPS